MAGSRIEADADRARAAALSNRSMRARQIAREESWFRPDPSHGSTPISDSKDAARLEQSREQAKKGELHWGAEDEDQSSQSAAGD